MSLTWNVSHDDQLVTIILIGALTYDAVETYLVAVRAESALGYRKLFDARQGYCDLTQSQLTSYLGSVSGYSRVSPLGPYAVVVGPDRGHSMAPALRILMLERSRPFRLFFDIDKARVWLSAHPIPGKTEPLGTSGD
jgi:hypothetical protein